MTATASLETKIRTARRSASTLQGRLTALVAEISAAIRASDPALSSLRSERQKVQGELSDLREQIGAFEAGMDDARRQDARPGYEAALAELEQHSQAYKDLLEKLPLHVASLEAFAASLTGSADRLSATLNLARSAAEEAGAPWPSFESPRIGNPLVERLNVASNRLSDMQLRADRILSDARARNPREAPGRQTIADRMAERARA